MNAKEFLKKKWGYSGQLTAEIMEEYRQYKLSEVTEEEIEDILDEHLKVDYFSHEGEHHTIIGGQKLAAKAITNLLKQQ